jgi:hypothetical protein
MHTHHDQEVFRGLVHQLMDAGWYRVGHEERPTGVSWQFRQGHILDAGAENERWILAPDEMTAMRIVMEEIRIERPEEPQRGSPLVRNQDLGRKLVVL